MQMKMKMKNENENENENLLLCAADKNMSISIQGSLKSEFYEQNVVKPRYEIIIRLLRITSKFCSVHIARNIAKI